MNKFVLRQSLLLLLTATIWGVAFVAQSVGMDYVGPFTFNVMRSIIGGVVLLPCIALLGKINGKGNTEAAKKMDGKERKTLFIGGIACGVLLCIASNLQQFGIMYTSVGKAGFITAMYIVVVPVLGIFLRKKVSGKVWCGVGIAVAGLYLLCMTESGFSVQKGDFLLMLCALAFSLHILVIDYFSPKADGVKLSCIQFFTCGILSGVGMVLTEKPQLTSILAAWMPEICLPKRCIPWMRSPRMTSRNTVGVQRRMISRAWNPFQRKAFRLIPLRQPVRMAGTRIGRLETTSSDLPEEAVRPSRSACSRASWGG